jgi:ABC-type polar amino acid transport system ATPase subunit
VGFVFQFFDLISTLSALENVELPLTMAGKRSSERRERSLNLLSMVGLAEKAPHKPDELDRSKRMRRKVLRSTDQSSETQPTSSLSSNWVSAEFLGRLYHCEVVFELDIARHSIAGPYSVAASGS